MWDCNKNQASALEAIILDGAKKILGCSSKTCCCTSSANVEFYNSTSERECTALWNAKCDKIGALERTI